MITVSDLSKRFGKLEVLKSIHVEFNAGKSYAMIGPNGSGKTTLIKCILGMVLESQLLMIGNTELKLAICHKLDAIRTK